jgi:hypothetical protein
MFANVPTRLSLSLADLEAFDPEAPEGGRERRFCCPLPGCADKRVDRAHRSLSLNTETGVWQCHRCKAGGRLREHWAPPAQVARAALRRAFGLRPALTEATTAVDETAWHVRWAAALPLAGTPGVAYLDKRGIPTHVAIAAGVRYAESWYGRPAVLFPVRDRAGVLVAVDGRHTDGRDDPKAHTAGTKKRGVFASCDALSAPRVAIVEGAIDALSLATCGMPAVALCGTTWPDWLPTALTFRRVAVGLDADATGDAAAHELSAQLRAFGARVERWRPSGVKDWNDALRAHGPQALRAALAEEQAEPESASYPAECDMNSTAAEEMGTAQAVVGAYCTAHRRHLVYGEQEIGACWWCQPERAPEGHAVRRLSPEQLRALVVRVPERPPIGQSVAAR